MSPHTCQSYNFRMLLQLFGQPPPCIRSSDPGTLRESRPGIELRPLSKNQREGKLHHMRGLSNPSKLKTKQAMSSLDFQ
jgi:hypothetical protein